jgi:hypothetical protein
MTVAERLGGGKVGRRQGWLSNLTSRTAETRECARDWSGVVGILVTATEPIWSVVNPGMAGRVGRAVRTWTGELVGLGGWNVLLNYRNLRQGTLDIGSGSGAGAIDELLSSRPGLLTSLFVERALGVAARRARATVKTFDKRGLLACSGRGHCDFRLTSRDSFPDRFWCRWAGLLLLPVAARGRRTLIPFCRVNERLVRPCCTCSRSILRSRSVASKC